MVTPYGAESTEKCLEATFPDDDLRLIPPVERGKKVERINQWFTLIANLGVVAGFVFLGVEIQQNTESLEQNRSLAIAQAHQERKDALDESYRSLANSDYLPGIFTKYEKEGPEAFTDEEMQRFIWQSFSGMSRLDSFHSWYEGGYVDEEFYDVNFRDVVRDLAPRWKAIGIWPVRPAFRQEVERIFEEE